MDFGFDRTRRWVAPSLPKRDASGASDLGMSFERSASSLTVEALQGGAFQA
jgi:hypothetical protein